MKNKTLFYALSFTWGLPMTLIGLISACVLLCLGHRPKVWGGCLSFTIGKHWGGVSLGIVMITDKGSTEITKNHEFGHALQNCRYGLLMPIFSLMSAVRYWYREIRERRGLDNKTDYDAFWLEGEATKLGNTYIGYWGDKNG